MARMISDKLFLTYEPLHGKTNNLHRRKQRRRSASQYFAVTAKLISAFVFATRTVQFLYFLNPKLSSVTVQTGLCQTWSEPKLLVFSRTGSYIHSLSLTDQLGWLSPDNQCV